MSLSAQPYVFQQIGLDSGALTILGRVIHRFQEPGEYRGVCLRSGQRAGVFHLKVEKGLSINQVNIDLATILGPATPASGDCGCHSAGLTSGDPSFTVAAGGYAVFHVSGGPGGFDVHVGAAAIAPPENREFDSAKLQNGDLFAATILRPGLYSVSNLAAKGGSPMELNVEYPPAQKKAFTPAAPVRIKTSGQGFDPKGVVKLVSPQTCIFVCESASRIKIELKHPYDSPAAK